MVSWSSGSRKTDPQLPLIFISQLTLSLKKSVVPSGISQLREKRAFAETSGIAPETAIKRWFHLLSHFLLLALFMWPDRNKRFKSERWR